MKEVEHDIETNVLQIHIIKALLYYDIFNYPLTASEIMRFLGTQQKDLASLRHELAVLTASKQIFQFDEFYSIQNSRANIERRLRGNGEAARFLPMAKTKAKFIARFPFVRAVFASGSLSKGYMDENADLDFFIITKPGRLWIARTLLVMYKRIFLFNSYKYFCVNYFVDFDHLEIEEKNLFTATELATVIPLYGAEYYHRLHNSNTWLGSYFPNYSKRPTQDVPSSATNWFTRTVENLMNVLGGNKLEEYFMKITMNRWQRVHGDSYGSDDFKIAFKSKKYASKNHPRHYQKKIISLYAEKLQAYNDKFNLTMKL
ncbi:nucleotidyltransferase domain-containing protein [Pseudochryseolinea flava]|uniref:nucleotidyltransferase domain-containing protein n=1 Tax=Pseudochryseolinea flava TaxID=2059302 RepID=UPI0010581C6F|nr:nucleotidyltransferase domain-containing protein [Pseudochryseolinea flava]